MHVSISVKAFLMVHFTNFIHASNWLLLWWWYDEVMVCWIFIPLQKALNISAVKFVPTSETIHFGNSYFAKVSFIIYTGSSIDKPFTFFTIANCCGNVQYIEEFYLES